MKPQGKPFQYKNPPPQTVQEHPQKAAIPAKVKVNGKNTKNVSQFFDIFRQCSGAQFCTSRGLCTPSGGGGSFLAGGGGGAKPPSRK